MAVMDHKDGKAASGTRPAALPSSPIQCRGSHRDAVRALAIGTTSDPETLSLPVPFRVLASYWY